MEDEKNTDLIRQENHDISMDRGDDPTYAQRLFSGRDDGEDDVSVQDADEREEAGKEKDAERLTGEEQAEKERSYKPFAERKSDGVRSRGEYVLERDLDNGPQYVPRDDEQADEADVDAFTKAEDEKIATSVSDQGTDFREEERKARIRRQIDKAAYERQQELLRQASEQQQEYNRQYFEQQEQYTVSEANKRQPVVRYIDGVPFVEDAEAAALPVRTRGSYPYGQGSYPYGNSGGDTDTYDGQQASHAEIVLGEDSGITDGREKGSPKNAPLTPDPMQGAGPALTGAATNTGNGDAPVSGPDARRSITISGHKKGRTGTIEVSASAKKSEGAAEVSSEKKASSSHYAARRKSTLGQGGNASSFVNLGYGAGAAAAVMSSNKNDERENSGGIPNIGIATANSVGSAGIIDKLREEREKEKAAKAAGSAGRAVHDGAAAENNAAANAHSRNGIIRIGPKSQFADPSKERDSKVRTGRISRFATRSSKGLITDGAVPAAGGITDASSNYRVIGKIPSTAAQSGQNSPAQGAVSFIKNKVRTILRAAAKKLVAGTVAASVATGAVAGGSVMMGMRSQDASGNKWVPIQAHLSADGTGRGKSLTQETLEFLHERMRAYGIQTTYASSSTATGAITIHMPGYGDSYSGYGGGDGDSTIMFIGQECFLIDGGWKTLSDMTIEYLKRRGVTEITAMVSHWHTDHYIALKRILEQGEIKVKTLYCPPPEEIRQWGSGDASVGNWMIKKVEEGGGTVIMPDAGTTNSYSVAGLRMTVWRKTPAFHEGMGVNGLSYDRYDVQNDASLQVYFPDIYYYTGGDMYYFLDEFLDSIKGSKIKLFKCCHHGNGSDAEVQRLRDEFGAEACWYNSVGRWGDLGGTYALAAIKARQLGLEVFQTTGDVDVSIGGGTATIRDRNGSYSYTCPYMGNSSSSITSDVSKYALSWVGENGEIIVPYKSSVTGNDPNGERSQPLAVGRSSDCSWFVYHVLMDCGVLADDTEFIHSYEWGSNPELYPNGQDVGTDLSLAKPGDVLCYAYGYPRAGSNSHVGIYIGNGEMVECAAGAGGVVKSSASDVSLISIVHFDTKAGTPSATVSPFIDLTTTETDSRYDFTPETEAIVEAHMHDFTYDNFDSFMAAHGGAENYVRSLGGVFAKWAGRDGYVQTAGEFQEIAEYVMGIYTIWGPDYMGGAGSHKFNAGWGDGDQDGRFYSGDAWRWWRDIPLEEVFFHDKEHIVTDCGCGIYHIMQKAGLRDFYGGTTYSDTAQREVDTSLGGRLIFNKEELQVGDLIQMSHSSDESGWGHVCVVGEIHADGKIIAYDTGNRYVNTGSYKKELIFNDDGSLGGDYDGYYHWFGQRMREIAQTGGITAGNSAAIQNLGDIRINDVTVDGEWRNKNDFDYKTLGRYSEGGRNTTTVRKKFKFVDKDGKEISPTGLTSMAGASSAGGSGADHTVGAGTVIEIPEGLGDIYTYMGWQLITAPSSQQYRLREQAGQNFDEEGFGRINGRYVIACTTTYGQVGDYVDFVKEDGLVLHCIIGDIKSRHDSGCTEWGHKGGRNIIEFVVDRDSWYPSGHVNPGNPSCHPEWSSDTVRAVNLGSYFTDPTSGGGNPLLFPTTSNDTEKAMYLALQVLSMSVLGSRYDDPSKKEPYQQYCFDVLDYAVCESGGASVRYTTTGESMVCEVEVTIHCDLAMLEENDKNFTSWGYEHPLGDPEPASYMGLPIKTFNEVFNIDTFAGGAAVNPFTGNEEIVYEFFLGKGLGAVQIAGIMANIKAESGFNPKAVNSSSGAKGLFQWLGGRAAALDSYAQSRGKDWTDINCQLEYAWTEIDGDSGWAGHLNEKKAFLSTSSAKEAAILFCTYWERAESGTAAKRGEIAEEYYSTIMSANTMGIGAADYVQWAIATANDDSHGYSQAARNGNPDYDCSSFVYYALKNSGYDVGDRVFATGGMPSVMVERLGFKMIPMPDDESQLRPGDILWWDGSGSNGHTEIYIGQGKKVGARGASYGSSAAGDLTGEEVAVTDYTGPGKFTHLFRK